MRSKTHEFDELQEWVDSIAAHQWSDSEYGALDAPPADSAVQIDRVAGEFFRSIWRKRLAAAQGDFGYVARQMRKAGVPLDLARAILLMPGSERDALNESDDSLERDDEPPSSQARLAIGRSLHREAAHAT